MKATRPLTLDHACTGCQLVEASEGERRGKLCALGVKHRARGGGRRAQPVIEAGDLNVLAGLNPKAECLDLLRYDVQSAHQNGSCKALVDDHLHRAQHALVLAFGIDHAHRLGLGLGDRKSVV